MTDYLKGKVAYIKGLTKPNEQHQLLLLLAETENRTPVQERQLNALIRAEKANDKAQKAKSELNKVLNAHKAAERKARDHELYNSAGLLIMAGLVDTKTGKPKISAAELLGGLLSLNGVHANDPKRQEWKAKGEQLMITNKK